MAGEVAADIIRKQLYGKEVKDLTEEEKQTISALSQLASGLAVAAGGGNIGDASAVISSSKNAVENNYLWLIRLVIPSRELSSGMLPIAIQSPQLAAQLLLVSELQLDTESAKQFVQSLPPGVLDNIVTEYRDDIFKEDMKGFSQAIIALYNESSETEHNNNPSLAGGGSAAIGGDPGLPPDDDNDKNKPNDKIKEEKLNDLPDNVQNTYSKYEKNGWNGNFNGQTPGTNAGRTFKNSDNQLPTVDSNGSPITYREFDVNNKIAGQARDAERFIRGSDGSVYYTNNHYQTFIKLIK